MMKSSTRNREYVQAHIGGWTSCCWSLSLAATSTRNIDLETIPLREPEQEVSGVPRLHLGADRCGGDQGERGGDGEIVV
jgi:hypothetical protein